MAGNFVQTQSPEPRCPNTHGHGSQSWLPLGPPRTNMKRFRVARPRLVSVAFEFPTGALVSLVGQAPGHVSAHPCLPKQWDPPGVQS